MFHAQPYVWYLGPCNTVHIVLSDNLVPCAILHILHYAISWEQAKLHVCCTNGSAKNIQTSIATGKMSGLRAAVQSKKEKKRKKKVPKHHNLIHIKWQCMQEGVNMHPFELLAFHEICVIQYIHRKHYPIIVLGWNWWCFIALFLMTNKPAY